MLTVAKKRKTWDPEQMKKAIDAVRSKTMGYKKAVKMFGVPRTTLRRLVHDLGESEKIVEKPLGRKTVLPPNIEKKLVEYILLMEAKYYGLTRIDVRRMAYQLALKNNIPNNFTKEIAGRSWLDLFLRRHKHELSLRKPLGTSFARVQGFNREAVKEFFEILKAEMEKIRYPPDRIFNVDETGLTIVQSKVPQIIGKKGKKQIGALTAAERGLLYECFRVFYTTHDDFPQKKLFRYTYERSSAWCYRQSPPIRLDSNEFIHRLVSSFSF